jgi:FixJ family two-component response regulator
MPPATGRVMVVDDEALVRELLHIFLAGEGYEAIAFATGTEALGAVPAFHPDVILVDRRMPGLSGTDVLDELRRTGVTVPVILISGTPGRPGEGFFWTLLKPFDLRTVGEVVAAAVNHRRSSEA